MGPSHRVASRLHSAYCYARRIHSLPPTLASFINKNTRHSPHNHHLVFTAVTLVLVLLLPWKVSRQPCHQEAQVMAVFMCAVMVLLLCLQTTPPHTPSLQQQQRWSWWKRLGDNWWFQEFLPEVVVSVWQRFLAFETAYMKLKNFSILVNQLVFFTMSERILMQQHKLTSLYTLMFYNVIVYCVTYVKEVVEREDWTMYVNIARTSNVRHLALSTTKMVLEWTKAVTFIITVVFLLLVMGLEKGLKDYSPTSGYLLLTGFYFLTTEKFSTKTLGSWFDDRKFDVFEGMECLYYPAIVLTSQLGLSTLLTVCCMSPGNLRLILLSSFTNIRVKYRELRSDHLDHLHQELLALSPYRAASRNEVRRHDDVCAVCLAPMTNARVTPCYHLFHGDCLRRCLKETNKCPICQYHL